MTVTSAAGPLTPERVNGLVRLLTDSLVNLKDENGTATVTSRDGKVVSQKEWSSWDWNQGVALAVLYNYSAAAPSASSSAASYARDTIMDWFESQWTATGGAGAPKNINTMAPLYALASLVGDGHAQDPRWEGWVREWAEWAMNDGPDGLARTQEGGFQHSKPFSKTALSQVTYRKVNEEQLWDDTLFMTVVPLARIGVLLGKAKYIDEVRYQCLVHVRYLQDTTTGLWFHGWEFTPPSGGHNFARCRWARGNCWITYAIPLLLEILGDHLPPTDPVRRTLVAAFRRQVDALLPLQHASGLWHTVLDDDTSYLEVSGTAGFATGIFMGVRTGILDRDTYLPAAERALAAVIANIQPDGTVVNVSYGTPIGDTIDFYKNIPLIPMPYGQGLAMAALVEWKRLHARAGAK